MLITKIAALISTDDPNYFHLLEPEKVNQFVFKMPELVFNIPTLDIHWFQVLGWSIFVIALFRFPSLGKLLVGLVIGTYHFAIGTLQFLFKILAFVIRKTQPN